MGKNNTFSDTAASRYSLALYELAEENKSVKGIEDQSSALIRLIDESKDFASIIRNPTYKKEDQIDVIILDPPRTGCHPNAVNSVIELKANKIAYVSCDPPSLARDLNMLVEGGYTIESVSPIDMFPQTYHTECVATLSLNYSS